MRLTAFTDYGLRMLMRMASAPDQAFSTADLADEFALSRHHLSKIMQRLARAGIIETKRGGGGGARLARPSDQLRLGSLIDILEEDQPIVACFADKNSSCTIEAQCRLRTRLRSAERAFIADLDRSTLADIALPAALPVA
ncbi:MAG: Rrf2 family transcriptional regulator [Rhodobacteraceae bacterium]|nr:Rrf2 family transcriptional regulator [Paracoccaceae bacterium]